MEKISKLEEFFNDVPKEKLALAAQFKGTAQAALAEGSQEAEELTRGYLYRAARVLGEECTVVLAQGAAGATAVRQIKTEFAGSLGQLITATEVIAFAAPVVQPGWEDRSHRVVIAPGLHSPKGQEAVAAHARHEVRQEAGPGSYWETVAVEHSAGIPGLLSRVVNALTGRNILGTVTSQPDVAGLEQAAKYRAWQITTSATRAALAQIPSAPVSSERVQAEITAAQDAARDMEQRIYQEVVRQYGARGGSG